jgi:hypothetical protein
LNLFMVESGPVDDATLPVGQALADVVTIGVLQQRAIQRRDVLAEQLQTALHSRVLIGQAKGILAERLQIDVAMPASSFDRAHATAPSAKGVADVGRGPAVAAAGRVLAHPGEACASRRSVNSIDTVEAGTSPGPRAAPFRRRRRIPLCQDLVRQGWPLKCCP